MCLCVFMYFMSCILLRCKWPIGPFAFNTLKLISRGENLTFLQILPTVASPSSSGLITWIPQTVYLTSEHIRC